MLNWAAPSHVQQLVIARQNARFALCHGVDEEAVLGNFPTLLRHAVAEALCARALGGLELLAPLERRIHMALASLMVPHLFFTGEQFQGPRNGTPARWLLLRKGLAEVRRADKQGRSEKHALLLHQIHRGGAIAALECILQVPCTHNVRAVGTCDTFALSHADLAAALAAHQPKLRASLERHARRLYARQESVFEAVIENAEGADKVRWHLLRAELGRAELLALKIARNLRDFSTPMAQRRLRQVRQKRSSGGGQGGGRGVSEESCSGARGASGGGEGSECGSDSEDGSAVFTRLERGCNLLSSSVIRRRRRPNLTKSLTRSSPLTEMAGQPPQSLPVGVSGRRASCGSDPGMDSMGGAGGMAPCSSPPRSSPPRISKLSRSSPARTSPNTKGSLAHNSQRSSVRSSVRSSIRSSLGDGGSGGEPWRTADVSQRGSITGTSVTVSAVPDPSVTDVEFFSLPMHVQATVAWLRRPLARGMAEPAGAAWGVCSPENWRSGGAELQICAQYGDRSARVTATGKARAAGIGHRGSIVREARIYAASSTHGDGCQTGFMIKGGGSLVRRCGGRCSTRGTRGSAQGSGCAVRPMADSLRRPTRTPKPRACTLNSHAGRCALLAQLRRRLERAATLLRQWWWQKLSIISFRRDSAQRQWWDALMLGYAATVLISTPFRIAFFTEHPIRNEIAIWLWIESLLDVSSIGDTFLRTFLLAPEADTTAAARDALWRRQQQCRLPFLLFLSVPLDLIALGSFARNWSFGAISALRLPKALRELTLLRDRLRSLALLERRLVRVGGVIAHARLILAIIGAVCVIGHWFGCIFFLCAALQPEGAASWARVDGLISTGRSGGRIFSQWMRAFYTGLGTLLVVPIGDIVPHTLAETVALMLIALFGVVINAALIGYISSTLTELDGAARAHEDVMSRLKAFCLSHRLPKNLQTALHEYVGESRELMRGYQETCVLRDLPPSVQQSLLLLRLGPTLRGLPFFSSAISSGAIRLILEASYETVAPAKAFIFRHTDVARDIYIVMSGQIDLWKHARGFKEEGGVSGAIVVRRREARSERVRCGRATGLGAGGSTRSPATCSRANRRVAPAPPPERGKRYQVSSGALEEGPLDGKGVLERREHGEPDASFPSPALIPAAANLAGVFRPRQLTRRFTSGASGDCRGAMADAEQGALESEGGSDADAEDAVDALGVGGWFGYEALRVGSKRIRRTTACAALRTTILVLPEPLLVKLQESHAQDYAQLTANASGFAFGASRVAATAAEPERGQKITEQPLSGRPIAAAKVTTAASATVTAAAVATAPTREEDRGWVLLPGSSLHVAWEVILLTLTLFTLCAIPYRIAFPEGPLSIRTNTSLHSIWEPSDYLVDVIFLCDVWLRYAHLAYVATGKVKKVGEVIRNPRAIGRRYRDTWLRRDLLSALPLQAFAHVPLLGDGGTHHHRRLAALRLLHLLRLQRLPDYSLSLNRLLNAFPLSRVALRLLKFLASLPLLAHVFGCLWFIIAQLETRACYDSTEGARWAANGTSETWGNASWLHATLSNSTFRESFAPNFENSACRFGLPSWAHLDGVAFSPEGVQYVRSVYFAATVLSTVGYGDIAPHTNGETAFMCVLTWIASLTFAVAIGLVSGLLSTSSDSKEEFKRKTEEALHYLSTHAVPRELQVAVRDFYAFKMRHAPLFTARRILDELPQWLRLSTCYQMHRRRLCVLPAFKDTPGGFLKEVASALMEKILLPHERVYKKGQAATAAVYFIGSGMLESRGRYTRLLSSRIPGYFGEAILGGKRMHSETVAALTHTVLYMLPLGHMDTICGHYPEEAVRFLKPSKREDCRTNGPRDSVAGGLLSLMRGLGGNLGLAHYGRSGLATSGSDGAPIDEDEETETRSINECACA